MSYTMSWRALLEWWWWCRCGRLRRGGVVESSRCPWGPVNGWRRIEGMWVNEDETIRRRRCLEGLRRLDERPTLALCNGYFLVSKKKN